MKSTRTITLAILSTLLPGISGFFALPAAAQPIEAPGTIQSFPVGYLPVALAFDGTSIWVANEGEGTVMKLRTSDGAVLHTSRVGYQPYALLFDGASIWVANQGDDTVSKLRASDGVIEGTFAVGGDPLALAL